MIKETITYTNFNDEKVTDTFYFNLTTAEWLRIDASYQSFGGIKGFLESATKKQDKEGILKLFEKLLLTSYGERPDGIKFVKNKELSDAFSYSEAYSELLMKFLQNTDEGIKFFNALSPKETSVPVVVNK